MIRIPLIYLSKTHAMDMNVLIHGKENCGEDAMYICW